MDMQLTECGFTKDGLKVTAATDAAGPQVIVKGTNGDGEEIHLLSHPLKDHAAAEELGKEVVKKGYQFYGGWVDLLNSDLFHHFLAVFGRILR